MRRLLICATVAAAIVNAEQLRISVYDKAGVPKEVMKDVYEQLGRIFRHSGIHAEVAAGDPAAAEAHLVVYNSGLSHLQYSEAACRARLDIAVDIGAAPRDVRMAVLGIAYPIASEGLNARVFEDHVAGLAYRENLPYSSMLAHAIAHEAGHVLLRTVAHERYGLMASAWKRQDLDWLKRTRIMFFTKEQSQAMRATLAGDRCNIPYRASGGRTAMPSRP
jgi:hypothetical protein